VLIGDKKISELNPLSGTLVAADDVLPIVDSSDIETKKITPDGLVQAGIRLMPAGSIPADKVAGGGGGGGTGSLNEVTGAAPIVVTGTGDARGVSITPATASAAGSMSAADKGKLDGIAAGAEPNVQADWNEANGSSAAFIRNKPTIGSPVDATTSVKGIVQLADAAAVTAGTASRVVTADQLKATNDALASATGGGITGLNGTAPIEVTGTGAIRTVGIKAATGSAAGSMSAADKTKLDALPSAGSIGTVTGVTGTSPIQVSGTTAPVVSVLAASTTVSGVVQLADAAAITAGTAGLVVDAAQLKAATDADDWTRTGTTLSPKAAGDVVTVSAGTAAAPGLAVVGDPDTGIYSPGADQLAVSTGGTERARIDSSGRLLVGSSAARAIGGGLQANTGSQLFIEGGAGDLALSTFVLNRNDTNPASIVIGKSRGTAAGGSTVLQNKDFVGRIVFAGADGTDVDTPAAFIEAAVDGTPGADVMPGRLGFSTTAAGAASPTERLGISSTGAVTINNLAGTGVSSVGVDASGNLTRHNVSLLPLLP
jgi:hypothetical protein